MTFYIKPTGGKDVILYQHFQTIQRQRIPTKYNWYREPFPRSTGAGGGSIYWHAILDISTLTPLTPLNITALNRLVRNGCMPKNHCSTAHPLDCGWPQMLLEAAHTVISSNCERAPCGGLPGILFIIVVLGDDYNLLSHKISRVEANSKLPNHGDVCTSLQKEKKRWDVWEGWQVTSRITTGMQAKNVSEWPGKDVSLARKK